MRIRYTILRDTGAGWIKYYINDYLRVVGMEEIQDYDLVDYDVKRDFVDCVQGWYKIGERVEIPFLKELN